MAVVGAGGLAVFVAVVVVVAGSVALFLYGSSSQCSSYAS